MSTKTKDQLLLDYRKSNKDRRAKIVQKAGFADEASYLSWLMAPDAVPEERPLIHNVHIIDISFSMNGPKLLSAIQGVNEELSELKKSTDVDYIQTIVQFSDPKDIKNVIWRQPMGLTQPYHAHAISGTALYQAVGQTLTLLRQAKQAGEKVLVKIFTDGGENTSQGEFKNPKELSKLIKACEEEDFTITFIGTDFDIKTVVDSLKIDISNTFAHDNTARGIHLSSSARIAATQTYANNVLKGKKVTKGFYKSLKTN